MGTADNLHVSVEIYTGTALADGQSHFAVSGWGPSYSNDFIYGRGIAIGDFGQSHVGVCSGVMIEHFTDNAMAPEHDGLIPGTCFPLDIKPHRWYKVDLLISQLNVYWYLTEINPYCWLPDTLVGEGGCIESSGSFCPRWKFDGNYGDGFVIGVVYDNTAQWKYRDFTLATF